MELRLNFGFFVRIWTGNNFFPTNTHNILKFQILEPVLRNCWMDLKLENIMLGEEISMNFLYSVNVHLETLSKESENWEVSKYSEKVPKSSSTPTRKFGSQFQKFPGIVNWSWIFHEVGKLSSDTPKSNVWFFVKFFPGS